MAVPVTPVHLALAVAVQSRSGGWLDGSIPVKSVVFVSPPGQPSHQAASQPVKLSVILVVNMTGTRPDRFVSSALGWGPQ